MGMSNDQDVTPNILVRLSGTKYLHVEIAGMISLLPVPYIAHRKNILVQYLLSAR